MQFYEKLTFLMNLTQTSNHMLAHALQVDPSLISRLHTGARGLPRNREHLKAMGSYFAKRCTTNYQRQALSELLEIKLALTLKRDQLAEIIYYWLCGDTDEAGRFMHTFEKLHYEASPSVSTVGHSDPASTNTLYYGNAGKRGAARAVYQYLLTLDSPCTVNLFADEADDWITEDYEFSQNLQQWGLELIRRGFHLCQITPPANSVEQAFESLIRWIPLYMTNQADVYFYPRIRDNVHRRSLIVVPGKIAMTSTSMANRRTSYATAVTTDQMLSQMYGTEFEEYLALCRPMLNTCTSPEDMMQCFIQFLALDGSRIQKLTSLSAETAPPELMAYCMEELENDDLKKMGKMYLQEMEEIEKKLVRYELIDIAPLAGADDVRAGRVPIIFSYGITPEPIYYTVELYILHLKNILRILENCENYHFIPLPGHEEHDSTFMIKEEQRALMVRTTPPFTVFEISSPFIVKLCREHLLRIAEQIGFASIHRVKIILQIKNLIRELQV